jgi:hypothetical protein
MKFETWLVKQKKRNDSIGDLSRDFIDARVAMRAERQPVRTIEDTFLRFSPCYDAQEALNKAKEEHVKFNSEDSTND